MAKLWIKVLKNHRIVMSEVEPLDNRDVQTALAGKLRELDLPSPLWLNKHCTEMDSFALTSFSADDFIEPIRFDKLDVSVIEDGETKRSKDPRNEF